jgi:hypothetical protein
MLATRVARLASVGLVLALFVPLFSIPASSVAQYRLSGVPIAFASWMILETSGIQCTFDLDATGANGDCVSNNVNVRVVTSNAQYSVADGLSVDLAVQNVGTLTLATTDGTTPDSSGVRLFVASGPFPTGGSGEVEIVNADGASPLTLERLYFQYAGSLLGSDGMLSPDETSGTKTWRLSAGPDVSRVDFSLGVAAEVPSSETSTPTSTPASTETPTPSSTPTNTASPTPTGSSTPTQTIPPTSTPTQTLLPTATATPVRTPTSTPQPTRTQKPAKPPRS